MKLVFCALAAAAFLYAQDDKRTTRIDVDNYVIDAQVNPETQTLRPTFLEPV